MNTHYEREEDHLALGLTRSPMFMGINLRLLFGNLMFCALFCINAHTFWGIPLFVVLHVVAVRLSIKEPNFFYLKFMSFLKTPPVLNRWYWGRVNSYEAW